MIQATITVNNDVGLHARPAAAFVKTAKTFDSDITVANLTRGADPVDAKSLVKIFKAAVASGHDIRITADGADEQAAVDALVGLIESNFGE